MRIKGFVLVILTGAAFCFATAFTLLVNKSPLQVSKANLPKYTQQVFSCSPRYIPTADESIPALTGWGNYHWKITTSSDSAQFYFDQGINMYYAFHIVESRASFDKAIRFDSSCAMAWWGKALSLGPNINDFEYQRPPDASTAVAQAKKTYAHCSAEERSLIDAIAVRYVPDTSIAQSKLNEQYTEAMHKVYLQYRKNADVVTLYADALMLLHPWDLYDHSYKPKAWTPELVSVLKGAMEISPDHPGANHYYIHAVEASAHPEDALKSANLLCTSMPSVAHITHMPSHIYIRSGYYAKGIEQNDKAVSGYQQYLQQFPSVQENLPLYSLHNLHMKVSCALMAGNYKAALAGSNELQEQIPSMYLSIPNAMGNYVQYLYQSKLFSYIRFGKWNELLHEPLTDTLAYTSVLQHFGRGLAFAKTNRVAEAQAELRAMEDKLASAPVLKEPMVPFSSASDASLVAKQILEGAIALAQKNMQDAVASFTKAVQAEDGMTYNEPRDWLLPARHYLGDALLKAGRYSEAIAVLKKDLENNPANGWALTGLDIAYKQLKKITEANAAKKRLHDVMLASDIVISSVVF